MMDNTMLEQLLADFKFVENIETNVIMPDDDTAKLIIEYREDVLDFYLDGKLVFSGDWTHNFAPLMARMLESWIGHLEAWN